MLSQVLVKKSINFKAVPLKMPASARLPLELRGDEGERKYKMAHFYSWTILSKTNTAFTDYTCNSWVNFCNTTVKSHVSKPINLCKLLVFFCTFEWIRIPCLSRQEGHLDYGLFLFTFMKPIVRGLISCQLKLDAFFLAMWLFVNVFAVQCVQGAPVERGSAQFGFDGAGELKFNYKLFDRSEK